MPHFFNILNVNMYIVYDAFGMLFFEYLIKRKGVEKVMSVF